MKTLNRIQHIIQRIRANNTHTAQQCNYADDYYGDRVCCLPATNQ